MRQKKEATTAINTRYPIDLLAALRDLAHQHQRSLNGEIVWALQQYVLQQRQRRGKGE